MERAESAADTDYLEFDELCKALHRKDPNCTEVAVIWDRERLNINNVVSKWCPVGYGPRLGRALKGNEFVQTIELQLGHLIPYSRENRINDGDANGVLDFLRRSASLRTVKLRTSGLWIGNEETLLMKLAVMAVAENPHGPLALHLDYVDVEEWSHPVDVPSDTLASALRATTSMEELLIWLGDGSYPEFYFDGEYDYFGYDEYGMPIIDEKEKEKIASRSLIAQGFRDNCSLKRLYILVDSDGLSVAALVDSLRHNGSLISVEYRDFTEVQRDRVQSYCTRNREISDAIAELGESDTDEVSRHKVDWLPIIPTLFAVVQHSPRMSASRFLQGLMGLADELGPANKLHMKRTRIER
jgi:hypothetical protein